MSTKLILDADTIVYRISAKYQESMGFEEDDEFGKDAYVDRESAYKELIETLQYCKDICGADEVSMHLTVDPDRLNFRYGILPSYKSNRTSERPILLEDLKNFLISRYGAKAHALIEADDACTIEFTAPYKGVKILGHVDKDLNQVAGQHYNFQKDKFYTITEEEAELWHYRQILEGDSTDGYKGCPGIGKTTAYDILKERRLAVPYFYEFKRGKKKGEKELRWTEEINPEASLWEVVLSWYYKGMITREGANFEEDICIGIDDSPVYHRALQQARVAYMLRDGDINGDAIYMWSPVTPTLKKPKGKSSEKKRT